MAPLEDLILTMRNGFDHRYAERFWQWSSTNAGRPAKHGRASFVRYWVFGFRFWVFGFGFSVLGFWFLVFGFWDQVTTGAPPGCGRLPVLAQQ
jgi:hypothetical protein